MSTDDLDPKHLEVLRYLAEAPDRYATAGTQLYGLEMEPGGRSTQVRLEGVFHFSTLKAMERRGLVAMKTRVQGMIGTPTGSFWTATITEIGREALAASDGQVVELDAGDREAEEPEDPRRTFRSELGSGRITLGVRQADLTVTAETESGSVSARVTVRLARDEVRRLHDELAEWLEESND